MSGPDKPGELNPLLDGATVTRADADGATVPLPATEVAKPEPKPPLRPGKVLLEKGHSQVDWMRLTRSHPDLAGLKGQPLRRSIPLAEVRQHRTREDAWTVLRGRVYNITPYLRFHPGGVDWMMKGAGRDCTALFQKYHPWVNAELMLERCLVGLAASPSQEHESRAAQEPG